MEIDPTETLSDLCVRKVYLRSNARESPGERLLDNADLPAPAGEGGPEMLVPNDAERGVHQVTEDGGGEAPVHPAVAGELGRDTDNAAAPARAAGAATELEARLDGVQGVGGGLRHGGRDRRERDLGQGSPAAAAGLGVGWHLSGPGWHGGARLLVGLLGAAHYTSRDIGWLVEFFIFI